MKRRTIVLPTKDNLFVDLTLHNVSAKLLAEFAKKIVRPYYSAHMSEALRDLIRNAIREEDFVLSRIKTVERGDYG